MIEFRTLGAIELLRPDGTALLSVVSRSKPLGLLVYLVLAAGGGTRRREDVCALLWPDSDEARARNALNQTVHSLRRAMGSEVIVGGREDVGVDATVVRCDAVEMLRAEKAGDPERVLSLYHGEFLPGYHVDGSPGLERWIESQRSQLQTVPFRAARQLAEARSAAGDDEEAVRALRRARTLRPEEDRTVRLLLATLAGSGNLAAAIDEYEKYRQHLETNYQIEPPDETRHFVDELRERNRRESRPETSGTPEYDEREPAPPGPDHQRVRKQPLARTRMIGAAGFVGVLCAVVLAFAVLKAPSEMPIEVRRLAVLPLQDFSPDGDKSYFANAMTEELITALGRLGHPEVVGFTSVRVYGDSVNIPQIARELEVDAVIEGSATWDGGTVRVNLQLVQVEPERHVWAHEWEGPDSALLSFQGRIAADVARRFGAPADRIRDLRHTGGLDHNVDPVALEAYYRGRALWKRYRHEESMAAFLEAVSIEPDWAPPWAGLADAYVLIAHTLEPPAEAMNRARRNIERAVELNPDLERTQVSLGHYLMEGPLDWEGSERAFQRAAQLNPGYPDTYVYLGQLYMALGRYGEARTAMERAFSLDPQNPVAFTDIGKIYLIERRYADAIAHFRKAVEVYPEHPITRGQLIYALLAASEWDEAIDLMREAISDGRGLSLSLGGRNPSISGWLAFALARKGQIEEAQTIADSLSDLATREYVLPLGIAAAYTGVGDRSTALHWLEMMEEEQSTQRVWLLAYPAFDELRGDPRFEAIVGRLGLRAGPGASDGAP